jgi:uncharacterized protein (DUF2141 family)
MHRLRLLSILALFVASCATQRPPGGGPPDTSAPYVEEMNPAPRSTRVTSSEVTFTFNEYVDRQSFQEALHITPFLDTPPEIEWSGRTVTVTLPQPLREEQTYVVMVGTGVKDQHAGNRMAAPVTLAFSTGDSIDNAAVQGRVFDPQPAAVSILAYRLDSTRADTLDIRRTRPDYAVQTGADGAFRLTNVSPGLYRVVAVRDNNRNYQYDVEIDDIGLPRADITALDSLPAEILRFQLHREDTTAPIIQSIAVESGRMLLVKFSENVLPWPPPAGSLGVRDSARGDSSFVVCATDAPGSRFALRCFLSAPLREGTQLLHARGLADSSGNALHIPEEGMRFSAMQVPDTARPVLTTVLPRKQDTDFPADSAFSLIFDRPVRPGEVTLRDSTGRAVMLSIEPVAPNNLRLTHPPLEQGMRHTLCVDGTGWADSANGRTVADSALCTNFVTGTENQAGTVSGTVTDDDSTSTTPRVVVLREATGRRATRSTVADERGGFRFSQVRPGMYLLDAIADRDGNGAFSHGSVYPFTPPERFGAGTDSVRVRARWETGGVRVRIPR